MMFPSRFRFASIQIFKFPIIKDRTLLPIPAVSNLEMASPFRIYTKDNAIERRITSFWVSMMCVPSTFLIRLLIVPYQLFATKSTVAIWEFFSLSIPRFTFGGT
ncbi:hypothetical protein ES703_34854 [subsurface metagenome]